MRAIAFGGPIPEPEPEPSAEYKLPAGWVVPLPPENISRVLPSDVNDWVQVAAKFGWSHPVGRALYAKNRAINGIPHNTSIAAIMKQCKESTAHRWLEHWNNGGSLKALKYTQESWNAHQRQRAAEDRERRKQWEKSR